MPHFFASDVTGVALALVLGIPLILLPGYSLGWWLNLFGFRSLSVNTRWFLAPGFGLTLVPILFYLPYRLISVNALWGIAALLCATGICACRTRESLPTWKLIAPSTRMAILAWLVLGVGLTLDIAIGSRLYPSNLIIDTSFRSQVISSLANTDHLPAPSYFFFPGYTVPLKYHYIYFLTPALMVRIGHGIVTSGMALLGLTLWTGIAMFGVVAAVIRFFWTFQNPQRATVIAWSLLGVGGLDLLFSSSQMLQRWSNNQFIFAVPDVGLWNSWGSAFTWLSTALWSPHHLGGLMAGTLGCLLLWHSRNFSGLTRWSHALAAGLAFGTLGGTSVYISAMFAVFLIIVVIELFLNCPRYLPPLIVAGVLGILVVLPFLLDVKPSSEAPAFFSFQVRPFLPVTLVLSSLGVHSRLAWNLSYLCALPLTYLTEFGIFFIGGAWWLYSRRHRPPEVQFRDHMIIGLGAISLIVPSFVWSGMEISNDLGFRGILPAQFLLLFCATEFLDQHWGSLATKKPNRLLWATAVSFLILGIGTNILEALTLRCGIGADSSRMIMSGEMFRTDASAERLEQLRSAYTWIRNTTPRNAVIQENPLTWQMVAQGQYSERRAAVYGSNPSYMVGDDHRLYLDTVIQIGTLFTIRTNSGSAKKICSRYGINYIVAQDGDPILSSSRSYSSNIAPVFATSLVRVFRCEW